MPYVTRYISDMCFKATIITKMLKIMSQQPTFIPKELTNLSYFHRKYLLKGEQSK